jgi:hypothetical protein
MVSVPEAMPVTSPVALLMLAVPLLLLQEPSNTVLDNDIVVPAHILDEPVMVPALGVVFTVTSCAAPMTPQLVLTV